MMKRENTSKSRKSRNISRSARPVIRKAAIESLEVRLVYSAFTDSAMVDPVAADGGAYALSADATQDTPTTFTNVDHATFAQGSPVLFTFTTAGSRTALLSRGGRLPSGLIFTDYGNGTGTITGTTTVEGTFHLVMTADNDVDPNITQNFTLTISTVSPETVVAGSDDGSGEIVVKNSNGSERFTLANPFENNDAMRVANGDVTGDGTADVILAAGKGGNSSINVYNGTDGTLVDSFAAFSSSFKGAVYVTSADVNHDGVSDIIVGKGRESGANASFRVFDGTDFSVMASVDAFGSSSDARVSAADLDGDGFAEVVVVQGNSAGASKVRTFSGQSLANGEINVLTTMTAFGNSYRAGGFVTTGDVNNDGQIDVILSKNSGTQATIIAFNGSDVATHQLHHRVHHRRHAGGPRLE